VNLIDSNVLIKNKTVKLNKNIKYNEWMF